MQLCNILITNTADHSMLTDTARYFTRATNTVGHSMLTDTRAVDDSYHLPVDHFYSIIAMINECRSGLTIGLNCY